MIREVCKMVGKSEQERGCRWEKASRGALVWLEGRVLEEFLERLI